MKKLKIFYSFLIFLIIFIWFVILSLPDGKLHVYACDVGQGDGFLVTKDNIQVVIDGGPNNNISSCVSNHMPFWDRKIEVVILTNPDRDHYYGLIQMLNQYSVDAFVATLTQKSGSEYEKLVDVVKQNEVKTINPYAGDSYRLANIYLNFYWPTAEEAKVADQSSASVNENSIVFILNFNNFKMLFTGDIMPPATDLVTGLFDVDIIKVPHHGSKNGLTEGMLEFSTPEAAIISSGIDNQWGHPNEETIKLLKNRGIKIYRTDQMGEIEVVSDGQSYQVIP